MEDTAHLFPCPSAPLTPCITLDQYNPTSKWEAHKILGASSPRIQSSPRSHIFPTLTPTPSGLPLHWRETTCGGTPNATGTPTCSFTHHTVGQPRGHPLQEVLGFFKLSLSLIFQRCSLYHCERIPTSLCVFLNSNIESLKPITVYRLLFPSMVMLPTSTSALSLAPWKIRPRPK